MTDAVVLQAINLFKQMPRKTVSYLSSTNLMKISVAFFLILMSYYGLRYWQYYEVGQQKATLTNQLQAATSRMATIHARYPNAAKFKSLAEQVKHMNTELQTKDSLLKMIHHTKQNKRDSFSAEFEALGESALPGVWLQSIAIKDAGKHLTLKGHALNKLLVPEYLQALNKQSVFAGKQFQTFELLGDKPGDEQVAFIFGTKPNEEIGFTRKTASEDDAS